MSTLAVVEFGAHHFLAWLLIGAIAGALAGRVMRGHGFGIFGDVVVGLVGAILGGVILHLVTGSNETGSFIGECIIAFIGAVILLFILRAVGGGRRRSI